MIEAETVVLGVGSPLMGDDGLGGDAVERLRERWDDDPAVAFLDGGTWGMRVLPFIEGARRLLLIDVIRRGGSPGTLVRLERAEIPRHLHHKLSPHQIDLGEVFDGDAPHRPGGAPAQACGGRSNGSFGNVHRRQASLPM